MLAVLLVLCLLVDVIALCIPLQAACQLLIPVSLTAAQQKFADTQGLGQPGALLPACRSMVTLFCILATHNRDSSFAELETARSPHWGIGLHTCSQPKGTTAKGVSTQDIHLHWPPTKSGHKCVCARMCLQAQQKIADSAGPALPVTLTFVGWTKVMPHRVNA